MPTYIYEVISEDCNAAPRRFEIVQRMSDEPLKAEPESGLPVRRVISAGVGFKSKRLKRGFRAQNSSHTSAGCSCCSGRHNR